MICKGYNRDEHCCWVDGKVCSFLEENTMKDRRWVCGLRRELDSWDKVHKDKRYLEKVQPMWDRIGRGCCGNFPDTSLGEFCNACGAGK